MSEVVTTEMLTHFFLGFLSGLSTVTVIWLIWTEAKRKRNQLERKIERLEE